MSFLRDSYRSRDYHKGTGSRVFLTENPDRYRLCDIPAQGLIGLINTHTNKLQLLFRKPITKNSKVKRAWLGVMGDRPGSPSQVRMSVDCKESDARSLKGGGGELGKLKP
jgi:hypothetical protein